VVPPWAAARWWTCRGWPGEDEALLQKIVEYNLDDVRAMEVTLRALVPAGAVAGTSDEALATVNGEFAPLLA
jgi:hypothetical protein